MALGNGMLCVPIGGNTPVMYQHGLECLSQSVIDRTMHIPAVCFGADVLTEDIMSSTCDLLN